MCFRINYDEPPVESSPVSLSPVNGPSVTSISLINNSHDSLVLDGELEHEMVSSSSVTVGSSQQSSPAMMAVRCRPGTAQDREKFYLGKIKALQAERNQLRKDAELEKQKALAATEQLTESVRQGQCKIDALATTLSQVQVRYFI